MDTNRYRNEASIVIERPAEDLYDLVADVSQMGRWSPVCTGGSYDDDGEWFTGTNAMGDSTWETRCRVVVADAGASSPSSTTASRVDLRWSAGASDSGPRTVPARRSPSRGRYCRHIPRASASTKTSATQVLDMMRQLAVQGMPETLAALKQHAEAQP